MKILITGSTGLIGKQLLDHLKGHELVLLTRNIEKAQFSLAHLALPHVDFISDLSTLSDLNDIDTVINLAGEPIADKKWTRKQKKIISDSRCKLTEQLAQLCLASTTPPRCFISGSAIGYYGDNGQKDIDEETKIVSADFAHQVCQQWENKALQVQSKNTRVCILRTGVVLSPLGGALKKMLLPYKFGLGLLLAGASFYILSISGASADENGMVPFGYLFVMYFILSIGELFMSPVGLSKITDLSPKNIVAFMMGVWFLSSAFAFQIVGFISKQLAVESSDANVGGLDTLGIYTDGFHLIAMYSLGAGAIVILFSPLMKKLMGNVH